MAVSITLEVTTRTDFGRHLPVSRRAGQVPAILYGHNLEPVSISANQRELEKVWMRAGRTHLVDVVVDGGKARKALIRELQRNPRSNRAIHADFFAVNLKEKLTADVPLVISGSAPAVDEFKLGQLLQVMSTIKVECLPQSVPAHISVDVSGLTELDAAVTVKDLHLPEGVTLVHTDLDDAVVKVAHVRVQEVEEPVAEAVVEPAAAEGEAPTEA